MQHAIGSCSLCGGNVVAPSTWAGTVPAVTKCTSCGAVPAKPKLPAIEMSPPAIGIVVRDMVTRLIFEPATHPTTVEDGA